MVLRRVVLRVVDAVDDGDVVALGRRRDDHLAGARREVLRRLVAVGEPAGGLEHDVDAQFLPRQLGGILLREHPHPVAVHQQGIARGFHRALEAAMHRVVLEQVGQRRRVGEVVHRHEVDVLDALLLRRAHHVAADATESVDPDLERHHSLPLMSPDGRHARHTENSTGSGALANVTASTRAAPASLSAVAAEARVAPVVHTSSTSTNVPCTCAGAMKAPCTLAARASGVSAVCVGVSRARWSRSTSGREPGGCRQCASPAPPPGCSPAFAAASARAAPAPARRPARAARVRASPAPWRSPRRATRCTSGDAPPRAPSPSSHTALRTRPSASGQPAQKRHATSTSPGCPHRAHHGGGTGVPSRPAERTDEPVPLARRHRGAAQEAFPRQEKALQRPDDRCDITPARHGRRRAWPRPAPASPETSGRRPRRPAAPAPRARRRREARVRAHRRTQPVSPLRIHQVERHFRVWRASVGIGSRSPAASPSGVALISTRHAAGVRRAHAERCSRPLGKLEAPRRRRAMSPRAPRPAPSPLPPPRATNRPCRPAATGPSGASQPVECGQDALDVGVVPDQRPISRHRSRRCCTRRSRAPTTKAGSPHARRPPCAGSSHCPRRLPWRATS